MHIVHVSRWRLPVQGYGGVPRVVYWLAKAQAEQGDRVTILAPPGSSCPGANCIAVKVARGQGDYSPYVASHLPPDADIVHFHHQVSVPPPCPWVITVQGNSPVELQALPNKIYISRDHARRGGGTAFVYNGIDPAEFIFRERKDDYFLFLSKVSLPKKGVDVALRLAREMGFRLLVAGGTRWSLRRTGGLWNSLVAKVHFCGEVSGRAKAELIAGARALILPIRWEEPFGLVVSEALVSGTAVITAPRGAMPELVTPEVGFLCDSYDAMKDAIGRVGEVDPHACRRRVLAELTNQHMASAYRQHYQAAIAAYSAGGMRPGASAGESG
ncbi:MAG: glycosyltransferase [Deltaproteobacteria bacterium]|nr:glycosyltransferase [Deltaproteobacteria bacterium]